MVPKIIPVIMSGGAGTRLWPASREKLPKQFMPLVGLRSIFQETALRVARDDLFEKPIIVSGVGYRHHVVTQLAEIGVSADVVLEPMRRDSGPAVAVATVLGLQRASNACCSCSHPITPSSGSIGFMKRAATRSPLQEEGMVVTFGIVPTEPSTDYGYLKPGDRIKGAQRRSMLSPRSPTWPRPSVTLPKAIFGTAATFSSRPRSCGKSLNDMRRRCWVQRAPPLTAGSAMPRC